jgi:hypothetical protein
LDTSETALSVASTRLLVVTDPLDLTVDEAVE